MALMKLTDGPNLVEFDPGFGYIEPQAYSEDISRSLSGKEYRYRWYKKRRWEIPLRFILKADADQLKTWRDNNEELDFYPDLINDDTLFYKVTIQNTETPLAKMAEPEWAIKYEGLLILEEN